MTNASGSEGQVHQTSMPLAVLPGCSIGMVPDPINPQRWSLALGSLMDEEAEPILLTWEQIQAMNRSALDKPSQMKVSVRGGGELLQDRPLSQKGTSPKQSSRETFVQPGASSLLGSGVSRVPNQATPFPGRDRHQVGPSSSPPVYSNQPLALIPKRHDSPPGDGPSSLLSRSYVSPTLEPVADRSGTGLNRRISNYSSPLSGPNHDRSDSIQLVSIQPAPSSYPVEMSPRKGSLRSGVTGDHNMNSRVFIRDSVPGGLYMEHSPSHYQPFASRDTISSPERRGLVGVAVAVLSKMLMITG